ncbi:hypothetical protein B4102_2274 [Heyndrickxia sporothermodurans]|uniref:Uncharacterized protein n=1 Tax=Heyndrickxia sporothermodurans TaxID=46224 RepID=A0A150LFG9_9BACI|nr:hypothetical protein B4102_2274 [Heyndrickxia sporothermodurans]
MKNFYRKFGNKHILEMIRKEIGLSWELKICRGKSIYSIYQSA